MSLERSLRAARNSESNVLIVGPTGTGKTTLAREIHATGPRSRGPFEIVNLASVHQGTLESELFGHLKGAFTGAEKRTGGLLERAQGGTLFLDEITEVPTTLQARLLEFLQTRSIRPVGGRETKVLNVRIIAASNRDLDHEVKSKRFRRDLYHRLKVILIELPSLAQIPFHFEEIVTRQLSEVGRRLGKVRGISTSALEALSKYSWPGNYRELKNAIECAMLFSEKDAIEARDLPEWVFSQENQSEDLPVDGDFREARRAFDRRFLKHALGKNGGRLNQTARATGVNRSTLSRMLRALAIDRRSCSNTLRVI